MAAELKADMKSLAALALLRLVVADQDGLAPAPSVPTSLPSEFSSSCIGTSAQDCVVYESGRVEGHSVDWGRGLYFQLQGTGLPGSGDKEYCKGGFCAIAILKLDEGGQMRLIAHAQSADAQWYETPEVVPSQAGPLIVARSNSLGSGNYNDDVVLREDDTGVMRRLDVNSWKAEARRLAPDANTHFDWRTDYGAFVGETGLASQVAGSSARDSVGVVRVFLVLEGDVLKVGSPVTRFPRGNVR